MIKVEENATAPAICGNDQVKRGLRIKRSNNTEAMALLSPAIARGWQSTILINSPPRLQSNAVITIKIMANALLMLYFSDEKSIMEINYPYMKEPAQADVR